MAKKQEPILIVTPFCSEEAEGDEIKMAIAGWRQHFKEPYKIVVVGDNPNIKGKDIVYVECPRIEPVEGKYRPHLDFVNKLRKVRASFPESKGFVFVADDCYLTKDCTLEDIRVLKARCSKIKASPWDRGFLGDKFRTMMLLVKEGLPYVDYSSHLPQWFEWDKLIALYDKYDMDNESYVFEDLYYNTYHKEEKPVVLDWNGYPYASFVFDNSITNMKHQVDVGINERMWLQNIAGLYTGYLSMRLREHYGL